MENKNNIPDFLIKAAEDAVATYILELDYQRNNEKIILFSAFAEVFCTNLFNEIEIVKNLKSKEDIFAYAEKVNKILQKEQKAFQMIGDIFLELQEHFLYSALKTFEDIREIFHSKFDEENEIWGNFLNYLITLIQINLDLKII